MNYRGKKCAVLGMARSGLAAARLLLREGAFPSILESRDDELSQRKALLLRSENITVFLGKEVDEDSTIYDLAILSPGIETTAPLVKKVTQHGTPLIGELELAYSCCHRPIIAITGTNGKTTTTELTTKALQGAGLRAIACGNIGLPFSEAILQNNQVDVFVVEASSFQLETIQRFRPRVALLLNLSPNHLDRYSSVEEYYAAKFNIFKNLSAEPSQSSSGGDVAVIPASLYRDELGIKVPYITFSTKSDDADFYFHDGLFFYQGKSFLSIKDTLLRGLHNAENLMAAFAAGRALGAPLERMVQAVKDYRAPAHRWW